jgi:membrane protein implicated in regulation of membrane protease activity
MNTNLNDWLGAHPLWLWLLLAVLLATLQLFRRDLLFTALTLAAALTGLVTVVWPHRQLAYCVVFALLAGLAVAAARRLESKPEPAPPKPPPD